MATSGRAHDAVAVEEDERRAMLVCRVIAGRVKRPPQEEEEAAAAEEYESVVGSAGVYSNLEELQVFNPRAILPCFVVVYKAS
uniref:PARP catalytic domain-containing protein n=1 Tax=Arundo donax TaxID=35708 RepID=A0A0A9FG36_ARUDO